MVDKRGTRNISLGRFGPAVGALAGLAVGIGITIVHSTLSPSQAKPTPNASPAAAPLASPVEAAVDNVDLKERLAEYVKAHRESIARHEREPRDERWATQVEQVLRGTLATLTGPKKFRITSVDCRTTSCVAYLSAASFHDAQRAWPSIVNARNDAKCGTEITLNEPQPGESVFDFSAVYDCSQIRQLEALGQK
jgi:hypothetical protein